MHKGRLEAFSDGVIAIILTIMVLELKVPHGQEFGDLVPLLPTFISYALSFVYVAIYWNNHHHMFQAVREVNGKILWANAHLLFWLSLIPFGTGWMGEHEFSKGPVVLYGGILFCAAIAYYMLSRALISHHGKDSPLAMAVGDDFKGRISLVVYAVAMPLAFLWSWLSVACYVSVAIMWLIPDRRIERELAKQ